MIPSFCRHSNSGSPVRSDDFLNAEKYPEIAFKSTSFEKMPDNKFKIAGDLTIRGITKPVVLHAAFNGTANFRNQTVASFDVTGEIDRTEFDVKWSRTMDNGGLVVSENIYFDFFIEVKTGGGNNN